MTENAICVDIEWQREHGWPDFHPEDYCHKCGRQNIVWFVDNELWNTVVGEDVGIILCPICFVKMAEVKGVKPKEQGAWELVCE